MRVSPVGWAFPTLEQTLAKAKRSAECTHNHPEGIKGAQATAAAIFLARTGESKTAIKAYVEKTFGYDLNGSIAAIRPGYEFDVSCQGTVPVALLAFLESVDFASSLQIAISVGGDTDTLACICGGIAEAFYRKIPELLLAFARKKLAPTMVPAADQFGKRYCEPCS
jgi:ADP-ribosylglycohydrolase